MKLLGVLNKLASGELSQTAIGGTGGIQPAHYLQMINHVNLGLMDIYKRFDLKKGIAIIQQYDHIQTYKLHPDFAETNTESLELYRYIMDSKEEPFLDDVISIERVFNEYGVECPLNDDMDYASLHTPTQTSIQIPLPEAENAIMVEYRASHPEIPDITTEEAMGAYELELPHAYLEPLMAYVASRVFAPIIDPQSPINESKDYLIKYELACQRITELAIPNIANNTKSHVRRNGWV